jgi:hypothetical protein
MQAVALMERLGADHDASHDRLPLVRSALERLTTVGLAFMPLPLKRLLVLVLALLLAEPSPRRLLAQTVSPPQCCARYRFRRRIKGIGGAPCVPT